MTNSYQRAMAHLEVTPEMRRRVLARVEKKMRPSYHRVVWPLAACLALVVALTALQPLWQDSPPDVMGPVSGVAAVSSVEELEDLVGFRVEQLGQLPFAVDQVDYTAVQGQLAEIRYAGEDQWLVLRKSAGTEDNSGDYTAYDAQTEITWSGGTAQLRGDGETWPVVWWTDGTYVCSMRCSRGLTAETWMELLEGME